MKVKRIGIVLESRDDALKTGITDLDQLYHWREPEEIAAITGAIEQLGFTPVILGTPADLCARVTEIKGQVDFIFNLSVGFRTRFRLGLGPALYELAGIPFSGADPYTKIVSQNKHLMKSFWEKCGIPTPEWVYLHESKEMENAAFPAFPLIVKPTFEGSSIGIPDCAVVKNRYDLETRINGIFRQYQMPVLVERFISGREYKVGVIGNEEIRFIGLIEDLCNGEPLQDKFLYYQAKTAGWFGKEKRELSCSGFSTLVEDCRKIYRYFLPVDYGTFDIRVDDEGRHYFLEFNADATLHPHRTLASCCRLHGMEYPEMIRVILESSFQRWGISWS